LKLRSRPRKRALRKLNRLRQRNKPVTSKPPKPRLQFL
jgi:hypothetical protein